MISTFLNAHWRRRNDSRFKLVLAVVGSSKAHPRANLRFLQRLP